ncbi:MAG: Zn-ribbon domain-containing OB-fold protein [Elusimicrobia bacterium]|nr:Zn-ribbon domain-containing OB-fold protein [Elusimicrobiota bacterium]
MDEILVHESRIAVPYAWSAGEVLSRFLKALRDERKILATRCPSCRKAYVPPRKTCGNCFEACGEWLEVGPRGTLLSFTQALYDSPAHPRPSPIYGLIRLEGADTALAHLVGESKLENLRLGMSVEAVFSESRSGSILDILHFRPAS